MRHFTFSHLVQSMESMPEWVRIGFIGGSLVHRGDYIEVVGVGKIMEGDVLFEDDGRYYIARRADIECA